MELLLKLGTGLAARFLGLVAENFALWMFNQVNEGADETADTLSQLRQFGRWFLQMLAGQLCGRSRHQFNDEDDYHPGLYGTR